MHRWSSQDDGLLLEVVNTLAGVLPKRAIFWHATAGALAVRELIVTPDAARTRYDRLRAIAEEKWRQESEAKKAQEDADAARAEALKAAERAAQEVEVLRSVEREVLGAETPEQAEDAWERVDRMVEEYERSLLEAVHEELGEVRAELVGVRAQVTILAAGHSLVAAQVAALLREWRNE